MKQMSGFVQLTNDFHQQITGNIRTYKESKNINQKHANIRPAIFGGLGFSKFYGLDIGCHQVTKNLDL